MKDLGHLGDDLADERRQRQGLRDGSGDVEHDRHLLVAGDEPAVEVEVLHRNGRLMGEGFEQLLVGLVERPAVALVMTWMTPMIAPAKLCTGPQRIERVW